MQNTITLQQHKPDNAEIAVMARKIYLNICDSFMKFPIPKAKWLSTATNTYNYNTSFLIVFQDYIDSLLNNSHFEIKFIQKNSNGTESYGIGVTNSLNIIQQKEI